jgi:hypothetical protein
MACRSGALLQALKISERRCLNLKPLPAKRGKKSKLPPVPKVRTEVGGMRGRARSLGKVFLGGK